MRLAGVLVLILAANLMITGQEPTPTPDVVREEVTVTANRIETRIGETPASVVVLSRESIGSSAAPSLDDVLRRSAGFSIFRRSSSRSANPTTQGVSLRAVGASGASRTGVFFDGVPVNDPFGGWVQWNRVPSVSVEDVEILRGGVSSLYGDAALSGSINIAPRKAEDGTTWFLDLFGGSQKTVSGSSFLGWKNRDWAFDLTGVKSQTRGYRPVDEDVRGPVDVFSGFRSSLLSARITRTITENSAIFLRPSYFGEVRTNGTGLQTNRTHIGQIVLGGEVRLEKRGLKLSWRTFGGDQVFDQVFSAVNAARNAESLNRIQRVPVQNAGFSGYVSFLWGGHTILAGGEARNVRGASDEVAFANGSPTTAIGPGGRQSTYGLFAQDFIRIGARAVVVGSLRYDRWHNYRAFSISRPLNGSAVTLINFPDRTESSLSPQVSVLYNISLTLSLFAGASRSFRSPTLNELYRGFRVGNVVTNPNEHLKAERTNNIEAGIGFDRGILSARTNIFWIGIDEPVSNITLSATQSLITRQRQNTGKARSVGVEADAAIRIRRFTVSAGYLFAHSTVTAFPSNPAIVGLRTPQVPKHQLTFQAEYRTGKWNISLQGRAAGEQFDDDLNLFRLEPFGQIDIFVSRRFAKKFESYVAVENIFNSTYSVGRTPIRTVGSPANVRAGIRWSYR